MISDVSARLLRLVVQATAPSPFEAVLFRVDQLTAPLPAREFLRWVTELQPPAAIHLAWDGQTAVISYQPVGRDAATSWPPDWLPPGAQPGPLLLVAAGQYLPLDPAALQRCQREFPGLRLPIWTGGSPDDPFIRRLALPEAATAEVAYVALLGGRLEYATDGSAHFSMDLRGSSWQAA